jgi:multiple sugar transport system substrate-binding protein
MLGGTGIAVSRHTTHQPEATAYAKWLASTEHQRGTYFRKGGQPASLKAWTDHSVDAAADSFFSGTLRTLQTAFVRPRFAGFVRFFESAGLEINRCLRGHLPDAELVGWLNEHYAAHRISARQIA